MGFRISNKHLRRGYFSGLHMNYSAYCSGSPLPNRVSKVLVIDDERMWRRRGRNIRCWGSLPEVNIEVYPEVALVGLFNLYNPLEMIAQTSELN